MLVFDATVLHHFARADRLADLADLTISHSCATTAVVLEELRAGAQRHPDLGKALALDWVGVIALDQIDEIRCFGEWIRRIGAGRHDLGEASVFAAAQTRRGIAVTDDRAATRVGRAHGLRVHGTLWLLAAACRSGKLTETAAGSLVESLRLTGHRLPCTGAEFPTFARRHGLL